MIFSRILIIEWVLIREYPNYNLWQTKNTFIPYKECFPKEEDPNIMQYVRVGEGDYSLRKIRKEQK